VTFVTWPTLKSPTLPALTVPPKEPVRRGQKKGRKPTSSSPTITRSDVQPTQRSSFRRDTGSMGGSVGAPTASAGPLGPPVPAGAVLLA